METDGSINTMKETTKCDDRRRYNTFEPCIIHHLFINKEKGHKLFYSVYIRSQLFITLSIKLLNTATV